MIVHIVPLISFFAAPGFLVSKEATSIVTRGAISRAELSGVADIGTGFLGLVGNVLWFIFAGVWLAIGHVVTATGCFLTIIGIPFGVQHLKLALLALAPVGKTIVTNEAADAARLYSAQARVARQRS